MTLGPYITTEPARYAAWGTPCDPVDLGKVTIDGRSFTVNRLAIPAFEVFERIRAVHDYKLTGNDTGFFSCRHMRHDPKLPWSVHAWAMALDINWLENPAGSKLTTDIPPAMIDDLYEVYTNSGAYVFRWGADWDRDGDSGDQGSYIDAMHWECVANPKDLATGIVWRTEVATYKGVINVPEDKNGNPKPWAKAVIDYGVSEESGPMIVTGDDHTDDWRANMDYGSYWTNEYRRRAS